MKNNYEFWEEYLLNLKKEIKKLCEKKDFLYIDFHIHSNYSSDGKQTIKKIIESTKSKGFDIIAITDHDSLDIYDELYEFVKDGFTKPLIIPGIEFTMDNCDYGNQCHILQLFINPKDRELFNNVKQNYNASFNRSKIQFKRLNENLAMKHLIKKYNINISYQKYINHINKNKMMPEYDTLCEFLMNKFKEKEISTFNILELLEHYNKLDCYEDRKNLKIKRYKKLREKYSETEENYFNTRLLLSMLAVKEVDDDWWDKPSSGSLSVNSYGQLKIEELNTKFITIFAHPTESKLNVVEDILKLKPSIIGLEKNIRNEYINILNFEKLIKENKLIKVIGSDSHDNSLKFYNDMNYYKIESSEILKLLEK